MKIRSRRAARAAAAVAAITAATLTLTTAPAHAVAPIQGSWEDSADFVDPDVCASFGLVVTGTWEQSAHWQVNLNPDGSFKEGFVHNHQHVVVHTNGKTMYEDDYWTELYRDGTVTLVGSPTREKSGGSIIVKDSGLVRFAEDGSIEKLAGPHPTLFGGGFCQYMV